jgi:hypothetical protein
VSLPFTRAASTPGALHVWNIAPREGGLHDRWSGCTHSCHGEAASLVTGAVDPTIPCGMLICLSGLLRPLRLAMIDRHVSLLQPPKKTKRNVEFSAVRLYNYCSEWTLQVSFACASRLISNRQEVAPLRQVQLQEQKEGCIASLMNCAA